MSLPTLDSGLRPPTSGYGATGTSCPTESSHTRRPFFLSLDTAEVPTPHKRRIVPLPSPPASPDTPLTSSDSETFSPESPTIKCLDPAHRPSPRAIQALRRQHPPIMVINDDRVEGSSRLLSPPQPTNGRSSWRSLWSSSSVESISALNHHHGLGHHHDVHHRLHHDHLGWHRPWQLFPMTSTPHRGSNRWTSPDSGLFCPTGCAVAVVLAVVVVALCLTLVPALLISRNMVQLKSEDIFATFKERPEVAIATW